MASTCPKRSDVLLYQIGRGLGYLFLGGIAGGFGFLLNLRDLPVGVRLVPPVLLGALFIFWGIEGLRKKRSKVHSPKFLSRTYSIFFRRFVSGSPGRRTFIIGLLSILLPCGMLYGVVLSTLVFQSFSLGVLALFFFWLGTLPSMVMAPVFVRSVLKPLKTRLPRFYGTVLILIGILTISFRVEGELKAHERKAPEQHCHSRLK